MITAIALFHGTLETLMFRGGLDWSVQDYWKVPDFPSECSEKELFRSGSGRLGSGVTLGSNFTVQIFCQVSFCRCKISGLELIFLELLLNLALPTPRGTSVPLRLPLRLYASAPLFLCTSTPLLFYAFISLRLYVFVSASIFLYLST